MTNLPSLLDKALPAINASKAQVVMLCSCDKNGSKNSYGYLRGKGVIENRLQILEGELRSGPM